MSVQEFLLSVSLGAGGYLAVNFWMRPLHRYIDLKHAVISDMVFYANAIRAEGMNDELKERKRERERRNRLNAAELTAAYYELPYLYKKVLKYREENPLEASKCLIGLSNDPDYDLASKYTGAIKKHLCLDEALDV